MAQISDDGGGGIPATGTTAPSGMRTATTGPTTVPDKISKLEDWQAALAAYVVLLYVAEVDSLKELAVALSVAVAVVVSLKDNPFQKVQ